MVVKVLHRVVRWNGNKQEFVLTVIIQNKPYVNSNIYYINVQWTPMSPNRNEQLMTVKQSF